MTIFVPGWVFAIALVASLFYIGWQIWQLVVIQRKQRDDIVAVNRQLRMAQELQQIDTNDPLPDEDECGYQARIG